MTLWLKRKLFINPAMFADEDITWMMRSLMNMYCLLQRRYLKHLNRRWCLFMMISQIEGSKKAFAGRDPVRGNARQTERGKT